MMEDGIVVKPFEPPMVPAGPSPWTHTAGSSGENFWITASGGIIEVVIDGATSIAKDIGPTVPTPVSLRPESSMTITYEGELTVKKLIGTGMAPSFL